MMLAGSGSINHMVEFINFIQKKAKEQNKHSVKLYSIHKNTIFIAAREHFK